MVSNRSPSRPSVMQYRDVPDADIPRSSLNSSHGHKTTFDAGYLVPIMAHEVLPGDTCSVRLTALARMATPLHPFMDNVFMNTFFFFVPNRLLWSNWEKMNGAQEDPGDSIDFLVPQIVSPAGGYGIGSIYDYLGIPTGVVGLSHNALFLRAYNLIFNEWFRDQNLQNSVTVNLGDGPDADTDYTLLRRGKRHDYFTSCLPFPQKGTSVPLPLTGNAPVTGLGALQPYTFAGGSQSVKEAGGVSTTYTSSRAANDATSLLLVEEDAANTGHPGIYADLSAVAAATINELRQAFQIQRLLERDARSGTRYVEVLRAHFGVTSPDFRLQRPEFLGGGQTMINVSQVPATAETATLPQGNLAAYATGMMSQHGFSKSFVEHGVVLGLASIRADLTYQQGLDRMWSRRTRYDYFWPALANIGEQAVLSKEIFADGSANDDDVFGYQARYEEYRGKRSLVTGEFRSAAAQSLDTWHLSEDFATRPLLNATFIEDDPPIDRVIATPTEPHFLFDGYFDMKCARPMPVYGVPGMIDHF